MNSKILREYKRLRAMGWKASEAMRAARVKDEFAALEDKGVVKLELVPDDEPADISYVDTWDVPNNTKDRIKKEIMDRIDREGVWSLVAYARKSQYDPWSVAWDCHGFIGDEVKDSGYDVDAKVAAIEFVL